MVAISSQSALSASSDFLFTSCLLIPHIMLFDHTFPPFTFPAHFPLHLGLKCLLGSVGSWRRLGISALTRGVRWVSWGAAVRFHWWKTCDDELVELEFSWWLCSVSTPILTRNLRFNTWLDEVTINSKSQNSQTMSPRSSRVPRFCPQCSARNTRGIEPLQDLIQVQYIISKHCSQWTPPSQLRTQSLHDHDLYKPGPAAHQREKCKAFHAKRGELAEFTFTSLAALSSESGYYG